MASIKDNLYFSWNFDTVSGSDQYGSYVVDDTINDNSGTAHGFTANTSSFIFKEELLTNKKVYLDTIDSEQTIQVLEEDDFKIDKIHKPSKLQLMIENSMYQVISDDMLNMFATIDSYAFKFNEPYNKYRDNYEKLEEMKKFFFSKVNDKPSLERYIEFYKWIDSALGDMIDQFKPESANNSQGLKHTVESHILERSKYKHNLPLTVDSKNIYSSGITNIKNLKDGSTERGIIGFKGSRTNSSSYNADNHNRSDDNIYAEDALESISLAGLNKNINIQNILNKNYKKNYQFFQTAGKYLNHQVESGSKSIFTTKFSSVDGLSDNNRLLSDEYSVYNDLNQRAFYQRQKYNELSGSKLTPYASTSSYSGNNYGKQGDNSRIISGALGLSYNTSNFIDNKFIQRHIPYTASNYHANTPDPINDLNNTLYIKIPNHKINILREGNILIDRNNEFYESSIDIQEPPITHNIPAKHKVNISTATQEVDIFSPYNTYIDFISDRNLSREKNYLNSAFSGSFLPNLKENTVSFVMDNNPAYFNIKTKEILNIIFPRKDLIGLSRVRSRGGFTGEEESRYEERNEKAFNDPNLYNYLDSLSSFSDSEILPYTNASYNNPYGTIRSFWRKDPIKRLRLNPYDVYIGTGSFNTFGFPNVKQSFSKYIRSVISGADNKNLVIQKTYTANLDSSMYTMDGDSQYTVTAQYVDENYDKITINLTKETAGELAPYSHFYLNRILLTGPTKSSYAGYPDLPTDSRVLPKPFFVYNNFIPPYLDGSTFYLNLNTSYQVPIDCRINPFYNTYTDFFANIKHKSQTFSIVPEFNVSNYEDILKNDKIFLKKYLKRFGDESPSQLENGYEDFYADLKKFVDVKSNKIKIKLSAIKKLLPYKGFYPQDRTVQIAGLFNKEYLKDTKYVPQLNKHALDGQLNLIQSGLIAFGVQKPHNFYKKFPYYIPLHRTLAAMQPLFMPGILYNSIKSGLGVSWPTTPVYLSSSVVETDPDPYGTQDTDLIEYGSQISQKIYQTSSTLYNYISGDSPSFSPTVGKLTYNLPFETILDPLAEYDYMLKYVCQRYDDNLTQDNVRYNYNSYPTSAAAPTSDEKFEVKSRTTIMPYLDPSHYSNVFGDVSDSSFVYPHESKKYIVKANLKEMINYFSKTTGILYKLAINNFLSETTNLFLNGVTLFSSAPEKEFFEAKAGSVYTMNVLIDRTPEYSMFNKYNITSSLYKVNSASLFGPAIDDQYYIKQVEEIYTSDRAYNPYTPPYFRDASKTKLKLIYTASSDGIPTLKNILDNLSIYFVTSSNYYVEGREANFKQMQVKDVIHYDIIRDLNTKDYDPDTGRRINPEINYGTSWVIQPKFECPLFTFEQCSTVVSGNLLT